MNVMQKAKQVLNARLVLPDQVINGSLLVENGRIASINPSEQLLTKEVETIDAHGLTIYPGFIDVHIHGSDGVDTMEAGSEDIVRVARFLASQGVTGWMPTLVPAPVEDYQRAISSIEKANAGGMGARILGVHYEGPFVNSTQCGALRKQFFRRYAGTSDLNDLPLINQSAGKHMMTIAPEVGGGLELIAELVRRGWIVSIGHTKADFGVLDKAFSLGARHMTHFMNAMSSLHHRSPGPVGWGLLHDDVTCDVIADGVHLESHTLQLVLKVKGSRRLLLISDAIAAAGLGDGVFKIWNESITVKDGRTSNQRGSIAGSVISMLDAVRVMQRLGAEEVELAHMSSTNPARLLGIEAECGSIEKGKRADLVALDDERKVRFTIVGGEMVRGSV